MTVNFNPAALQEIGLSPTEVAVYLRLLELGPSRAGSLIRATGIQNSVMHLTLGRLAAQGFVSYIVRGKVRSYQAADPRYLLQLLDARRQRIERLVPHLEALRSLHSVPEAEIYEGLTGLKNMCSLNCTGATSFFAHQETFLPILRYKIPVRLLKYHPHGSVLFVTFSVEEGLLLLANPLCEAIIKSCLARAQHMHPIDICHLVVESTHLHLLMVVKNPDDVSGFIGYFKTESAHMLNRILGRSKRTVWCEGYDSPVVLTPIRALTAIAYLYSNPAKDNLVETIDRYPGISSWKMFLKKEYSKLWKRLRRPAFTELPTGSHNLPGYTVEAEKLLSEAKGTHEFHLTPNAWLEAFEIVDPVEQEKWNATLIERVKTLELRAAKKRAALDRLVMGRDKLMNQPINTTYRPKRSGKRMCCLSEDRSTRIDFINFIKDLYAKAKAVAERWKLGDYSLPYPLGLYPPSMPKLAEPLGIW